MSDRPPPEPAGTHAGSEAAPPAPGVSHAQQLLGSLGVLQPGVTAFHTTVRLQLAGPLSVTLLERALNAVIERHEALRLCCKEQGGQLLQVERTVFKLKLDVVDISERPAQMKEEAAERLCHVDGQRAFPLGTGPLIRALLIRLAPSSHQFQVTVHPAVFDRVSASVLTADIATFYQAFLNGNPCPLEPLPSLLGTGGEQRQPGTDNPDMQRQLDWWKQQLQGMDELDLPTEFPRPATPSWRCDSTRVLLPRALTECLHTIAAHNGAALAHVHLAALVILLHRYTGSTDIAVGTPGEGRTAFGMKPLIGQFSQWVVLRNDLSGHPSFERFLARVLDTAAQAMVHQNLPFGSLVRELRPRPDPSRHPLFQVQFSQGEPTVHAHAVGDLLLTPLPVPPPGILFDLSLRLTEHEDGWHAVCEYSVDLFSRAFADRLLGHFRRLLEGIAHDPAQPIDALEMLTEAERTLLLGDWKGATTAYPREATIGELFESTAQRFAHRPALRSGKALLSYQQLHAEASRLALQLLDAGVVPGELIAISARASPEMIVGFLGILMAGGCCVPIDPAYPRERFALLLDDCGASIGLVTAGCEAAFPQHWPGTLITIAPTGHAREAVDRPGVALTAEHPAHLLFTSGSTGRPKGVLLRHRGVVRLVRGQNFMPITPEDVFLQAAPVSFDASVLEIWGPLLNGGCLVLMPDGPGIPQIAQAIAEHGVTTLWLTSGLFQVIISERPQALLGLKYLLSGGDVLSPLHVQRALECLPGTQLINGYGPTENTTFTTCHWIAPADVRRSSIPIGRPIANTTVYLLDAMLRPVPVGIPGELHAGGDGLAIGYHGAPEHTAEKFIHHPVLGRLYRTGDRCRRVADGTIEFLGRSDHQVKVRGFRIELGEIETLLASHPHISQAKVAVRGDHAETKRILAWVIPAASDPPEAELNARLTAFLAARLPSYMRPEAIGIVESFPLNANGKVQTSALPDPAQHRGHRDAVPSAPPVGDTELKLAGIWGNLLGLPGVGRDEDFFALGGNSLMALRMFSAIHQAFGHSPPLASLLQHSTIAGLSRAVALSGAGVEEQASVPAGRGSLVPIAQGGGELPLICIHGGDGGVLFYRSLAALMPAEIPLHAIESLELGSAGPVAPSSIEDTATGYIRNVQAVQPRGPYRLAGYSFGGVVAHEMALQLTRDGHEVEFLGLFDTHNPAAPVRPYSMPERLQVFWAQHAGVPVWRRLLLVHARLREGIQAHRRVRAELRAAQGSGPADPYSDLRRVQVRQHNWRAMQAYRPQPYAGRITLFKASAVNDKLERADDYGWSTVASGGLDVVRVAGEHLTLFAPENIASLAQALTDSLRACSRPAR